MDNSHGITISARDRVFTAWQDSMELVRYYEGYSKEIKNNRKASGLFAEFAEEEAVHAAKLLEILREYEEK